MQSRRSWLGKIIYNVREFIWPLLEHEPKNSAPPAPVPAFELLVESENLDQFLSLTAKMSESEEDRRKGIESKASLFISTISVATSIVVAANAMVVSAKDYGFEIVISVLISFILSIYAARTVWFAVKALERGNYSMLGITEINFKGNKEQYQKHLIECLIKNRKNNIQTVNSKVDNVTMAQEYYKRAIMMICVYSCYVLVQCLLKYQQ